MKPWVACVFLFFAVLASSQARPAGPSRVAMAHAGCSFGDQTVIGKIPGEWKQAYNNQDAARVASLYKEDAYYLTQHFATGIVQSRQNIQAYVQRGVDAGYRIDSIDILRLECAGDFAYTITQYRATNGSDKTIGVNLVVLRKSGGRWLIVAHEAAVPDPDTAVKSLDIPRHH